MTEFFTENMIPYTFRDEREFTYRCPSTVPAQNDLLAACRGAAHQARLRHRGAVARRSVRPLLGR